MHSIGITFFTKWEVSTHEAVTFKYRYYFFPTSVPPPPKKKKNGTRMFRSLSILEKMHLLILMYLTLILLTNTKIDHVTYIHCA